MKHADTFLYDLSNKLEDLGIDQAFQRRYSMAASCTNISVEWPYYTSLWHLLLELLTKAEKQLYHSCDDQTEHNRNSYMDRYESMLNDGRSTYKREWMLL